MQFQLTNSLAAASIQLIIIHIPTFKVTNNSVVLDQLSIAHHIFLMDTISRLGSIKDLDNSKVFHLLDSRTA